MKILGNKFLRSDYKGGDPVRVTAAAPQQNRVANILKNIEGVGCRVHKPIDASGDGWRIIVDGSSDVRFPPGASLPWKDLLFDARSDESNIVTTDWGVVSLASVSTIDAPLSAYIYSTDCHGVVIPAQLRGRRLKLHMRVQFYPAAIEDSYLLQAGFGLGATATPLIGAFTPLDGETDIGCASIGVPATDLGVSIDAEAAHTHDVTSLSETTTAGTSHTHGITIGEFVSPADSVSIESRLTIGDDAPYVIAAIVRAYPYGGASVGSSSCYARLIAEVE